MGKFYVLECMSPLRKAYFTLEVDDSAKQKSWTRGMLFTPEAEWEDDHPPGEPIELRTGPEENDKPMFVYPELTWSPIPLMTRRLVAALREAGVDNLQTYQTQLTVVQGTELPPPDHYLAVNVGGLVAAADLQKSQLNTNVAERLIAMDFHSLAIDEARARDLLMFRLAENISAVMVHENVKQTIEARGIDTLTWYEPEEWAG